MPNRRRRLWDILQIGTIILCTYYITMIFNQNYIVHVTNECTLQQNKSVATMQIPLTKTNVNNQKPSLCPNGGITVHELYCVLPYWAISERKSGPGTITLCTQGTYEFLYHVITLCERWQGPMSVAVYNPNDNSSIHTANIIASLRYCSTCISSWVDWHIFYKKTFSKSLPQLLINRGRIIDCDFKKYSQSLGTKKRVKNGGNVYPINVARNLARSYTNTNYVFSIDIELYPSSNVNLRFEKMISEQKGLFKSNKVWVLPVFEVKRNYEPPKTKAELRTYYFKKIAISFHKYRCNACHKIPNLTEWMNHVSDYEKTGNVHQLQPFQIFSTVKRNRDFQLQVWEPFFIGTKNEPQFDYRLSWEGKNNKMQMAYEMCLLDYDFHILDDAFLVHAPGINIYKRQAESYREWYAKQNAALMKTIKKNLLGKYGKHSEC